MDLRTYLFCKRITSKRMSKDLMMSSSYFSLLKAEKVRPSRRLAKDIYNYTNGEISMEYLLSLPIYQRKTNEVAK